MADSQAEKVRANFVTMQMSPEEWADYIWREYNALADRYEESLAEFVTLKDALEAAGWEQEHGGCECRTCAALRQREPA